MPSIPPVRKPRKSAAEAQSRAIPAKAYARPRPTIQEPPAPTATATATATAASGAGQAPPAKGAHGGRRARSGRKPGSGLLGDTLCMRIPRVNAQAIMAARDALANGHPWQGPPPALALFEPNPSAGFRPPSDSTGPRVDLYTLLSPRPESTFLVRVAGWSMRASGIHDGDYLLVDSSIAPLDGHVVVAHVEGLGLLPRRLRVARSGSFLDSDDKDAPTLALGVDSPPKILGVARAKAGPLL